MKKDFAIYFILLIQFFSIKINFGEIISSKSLMEQLYVENIILPSLHGSISRNSICDLPKEKKITLCKAVIEKLNNELILRVNFSMKKYDFYLNKTALFYEDLNCTPQEIKLSPKYRRARNISQNMFQCYGRNEPVRTHFIEDDNYDLLYLSDGPYYDSVYLFIHVKLIDTEKYEFYRLITNVKIARLPYTELHWNYDVLPELNSLNNLSENYDFYEIEVNYFREIVHKGILQDSVCEMEKEKKISLCEKVLGNQLYIFHRDHFEFKSTDCILNRLKFQGLYSMQFNSHQLKRNMYPCHGIYPTLSSNISPTIFYLSGGYRRNSVLVFASIDVSYTQLVHFHMHVENVPENLMPITFP